MDSFVSNIFIDGKECSKENSIVDWNFPPIFDNYLVKIVSCAIVKLWKMMMRLSLFKYKRSLILQKRII